MRTEKNYNNDDRIIKLKESVDKKRNEIKKGNRRYAPITNCMLTLFNQSINIRVSADNFLLSFLESIAQAGESIGKNRKDIIISSFSIADWIEDVQGFIDMKETLEQDKKLANIEKKLDSMMTDEKKTEIELDSISQFLTDF